MRDHRDWKFVAQNADIGADSDAPAPMVRKESVSLLPMTIDEAARLREIRRMFGQFLMGWASDVLVLRQAKRDSLRWPGEHPAQSDWGDWPLAA